MNSKLHLRFGSRHNLGQRGPSAWWIASVVLLALLPFASSAQITGDTAARRLLQEGRADEALSVLERELVKRPRDGQLLLLKGAALSSTDQKDEAIKLFRQMVSAKIEEASAYNNLAVIYASRGDYDAARLALEWAVRSKPDYGTAHHNLGNVYANLAALNYRQALQLDGNDQSLPAKLSRLGDLLGHPAENLADSRPAAYERGDAMVKAPALDSNPISSRSSSAGRVDASARGLGLSSVGRYSASALQDQTSGINTEGRQHLGKRQSVIAGTSDEIESVYARMQLERQRSVASRGVGIATAGKAESEPAVDVTKQSSVLTGNSTQPSPKRAERLTKAPPVTGSVYARLLSERRNERSRQEATASPITAQQSEAGSRQQHVSSVTQKNPGVKAIESGRKAPATSSTLDTRSPLERRDDYRNGNWVAGRLALRL